MTDHKDLEIPRYGHSGVSFLGAEFKDCLLLLASIPLAMFLANYNAWAYAVVPGAAYVINRQYLQWLASGPPGRLRLWAYELGLLGYSDAHATRDCLFVGDARVINPASRELIDAAHARRLVSTEVTHGA